MSATLPRPEGFDVELNFYVNVLKFKSLHWGYWKNINNHSLSNLGKAQEAYTLKLISLVPKGVKTVLDVGAGIGDNAILFSKHGYKVLAISPEPTQRKIFNELSKNYENISFIQSKYEDLNLETKFDLILMSESSNYFPLKKGMRQTAKYLKNGGYLLVAGLFRKRNTKVFSTWNIYSDFEKQAERVGLTLIKKEDITGPTAPTMQLGYKFYKDYLEPSADLLTDWYKKAFRWKTIFISLFFRKEIKLMKYILYEDLDNRLNVQQFKKHGRYLIYL